MSIAVVIPLFNHEQYITAALHSIFAQSRLVDRVVVVDDGSSDRSVEVVRGCDDKRITLITGHNSGAHDALNRGIREAADCDFIAILNSDDVYHPERIEHCVGYLERNPKSDVVCTGLKLIDSLGQELPATDPKARWVDSVWKMGRNDYLEWLGIANFAKTSSNFVARSAYLLAHPFRAYRYVHDYFFILHCAIEHRLRVIDRELLYYRTHPCNTIKFGPGEDVTREVLQMNLDFLQVIAPQLARSTRTRLDYAQYMRVLMLNHADFRAELFLYATSQLLKQNPEGKISATLAKMSAADFPELTHKPSRRFRAEMAANRYAERQRGVIQSRWVALGRLLGMVDGLLEFDTGGPEANLAAFEKRIKHSRWLRLGRKFGWGPALDQSS